MKKLLLKMIVFCSIFLSFFSNIWNVFSYKDTLDSAIWSSKHFYETTKNTIDVMFYGNSQCHCNVNTSILWEKYGIASFLFTGAGRGISTIYYSIEESLKTQTPKLLVVEVTPAIYDLYYNPKALYRNTITLKYSSTFIDNILSFVPNDKLVNVLLKFPIFHSRYTNLTSMDFQDTLYFNRGFVGRSGIAKLDTINNATTDDIIFISEECNYYLEKIILLSKEKNIPLLLFVAPANISNDNKAKQNSISIIAEKYDIPYINFNSSEFDININYDRDFESENHLNFYGARKMTEYLCDYINENYNIPNRKNNPDYFLWELDSEYIQKMENKFYLANYSLEESLLFLQNHSDEYTYIISLMPNTNLSSSLCSFLNKFDIEPSILKEETVFIINENKLIYCGNYDMMWHTIVDNDLTLAVNNNDGNQLLLNNNNYYDASHGVNIIAYDNFLKKVVKQIYE